MPPKLKFTTQNKHLKVSEHTTFVKGKHTLSFREKHKSSIVTKRDRKCRSSKRMSEIFKLFGKTISIKVASDESLSELRHTSFASSASQDSSKEESGGEYESTTDPSSEKSTSSDEVKTKMVACPRCSSTDTKFCYYNNYNVKQPRHLCKKCQRYWTSGGTMRNVPVGSGRRKTKTNAANYPHHIITTQGGFPVSFYPATLFWGSSPLQPYGSDNRPPLPLLGKHSREEGRDHLVPKTLRIHDPIQAANSSIWSTLGINNNNTITTTVGMFQSNSKAKSLDRRQMLMQANPAAFSRSLNFHERA